MSPTSAGPSSPASAVGCELLDEIVRARTTRENVVLATTDAADTTLEFARAVAHGLRRDQRALDSRFLYDERGSALFEEICDQPEYYPTRTEAAILARHAPDIRALTGPVTLVELGAGTAAKTTHLLDAYTAADTRAHYVPIDVSRAALEEAERAITARHPDAHVTAVHGEYESVFPLLAHLSPTMVIFLGSTIGNFPPDAADDFWRKIRAHLQPGDFVLLGVDLDKDPEVLEAAYNDAAGVTARFTTNLFARMNRELGAEIDVDAVQHVATYNGERRQIETYARFLKPQRIDLAPLDEAFEVRAGEDILVEISRKFRLHALRPRLAAAGLHTRQVFTDEREWFALLLLQRV